MSSASAMWRCPLRSHKPGVDHFRQLEHCLQGKLVGIGWGLGEDPDGLDHALRLTSARGWKRAPGIIRRFAEAQNGDLVWSLGLDGRYLLGEVAGEWYYDGSETAELVDCHHVRRMHWAPRPLLDAEVPGAVVRAFMRPGTSFERIKNRAARHYSRALLDELLGRVVQPFAPEPHVVLRDMLDPFDVEDLVYVYLQAVHNWLVLPASRRTNTATYEYVLVHRDTQQLAIAQVKSGDSAVPMEELARAAGADHIAFAYSTGGHYDGDGGGRVHIIEEADLLDFAARCPHQLPPRARRWFTSGAE